MSVTAKVQWVARRIADTQRLFQSVRTSPLGMRAAVPRSLKLIFKERYSPTEVLMLGLLRGAPLIREASFISKRQMLSRQRQLNPRMYFRYTENKLVFFRRCVDHALPTPRVFAAFCRESCDPLVVPLVQRPSELLALLGPVGRCDVVVKPVGGVHGEGILVLKFDGATFTDTEGRTYPADEILALARRTRFPNWLLQERLYPHRDLIALSGSGYLQTARVVSFVDRQGHATIPIAWLRILGGPSVFDNFNFGTSGNLVATIDVETGRLKHVLGPGKAGHGLEERARHPVTAVSFADFTVPFMPEVRNVVIRAAQAFTPLRTIGWDVALTDTGPSLIEGNVTWDPLPTLVDLRAVAATLE